MDNTLGGPPSTADFASASANTANDRLDRLSCDLRIDRATTQVRLRVLEETVKVLERALLHQTGLG